MPRIAGISARCGPLNSAKPGEHGRHHRAADEALDHPEQRHRVDVPGHSAQRTGQREQSGRQRVQPARRQRLRQERGERDHHQFRHQVAGLHPADLVRAGREPGLDLVERGGHDLDVDQRHEHAERHHAEDQEFARQRQVGGGDVRGGGCGVHGRLLHRR